MVHEDYVAEPTSTYVTTHVSREGKPACSKGKTENMQI